MVLEFPSVVPCRFHFQSEMSLSPLREISVFTQKSFKIFSFCNALGHVFNLFNGGSILTELQSHTRM